MIHTKKIIISASAVFTVLTGCTTTQLKQTLRRERSQKINTDYSEIFFPARARSKRIIQGKN